MKGNLPKPITKLEKLFIGGYISLMLIYAGLLVNISVDDSKAVAKVSTTPRYKWY